MSPSRLVLLALLSLPMFAVAQTTLISQKKPVVASSQEPGLTPAAAVDGVATTRWGSTFSDPQWIYVDLGTVSNISRVVLNWEAAYAKAYQIQVSNDAATWTTLYSTTTGDGGTDDLALTGSGRYVRMNGTTRATGYGYSLYEFQVYGADPAIPAVAAVASSKEGNLGPQYAIDNNAGTRWGSNFNDAEWIYQDLGTSVTVSRVVLKWEGAYGRGYQIQVSSDASNWTTVFTTTTGDGGTDDLAITKTSGRYVRMNGVTRATGYGYSLWEFQVYGTSGATGFSSSTAASVASSASSKSSLVSTSSAANTSSKSSVSSLATINSSSSLSKSSASSALAQAYPKKVFFIGNSFTYYGPVPKLVETMARYNGFSDVTIDYRAIASATLTQHKNDTAADGAPARLQAGWDAVVLQDQSTRPTDSGDPLGFYDDVTWFYDYIKTINTNTRVYLYETWAWRYDSTQYPTPFATPTQMQAELRYHYNEAAAHYVPTHSKFAPIAALPVAPVGDAWELDLQNGEADGRLHDPDSHHANALGQYLNALVLYSTLFDRSSKGIIPLGGITETQALHLQEIADSTSKRQGVGIDKSAPLSVATGSSFLIDIGPLPGAGWVSLKNNETASHISTASGQVSSINVTVWGFQGEQTGGALTNTFGWPENVSRDSLWVGSNNTHADALLNEGRVVFRGLAAGNYKMEIFGSRDGNDGGLGRITRFTVGDKFADLETSDNNSRTGVLTVSPDSNGVILLRVGVSPDSISRLGYLGAIKLTRL
jgi:hypothetical protein